MTKIFFALLIFSLASFTPNTFAQNTVVKVRPKKKAVQTTPAATNTYTAPNSYVTGTAAAATPAPVQAQPVRNTMLAAPALSPAPLAPTPAPPSPWKLSYLVEYQGPTLGGDFDLAKTQTPGKDAGYSEIDHYLKFGYAVSPNVSIGTQFRAFSPTDPTANFGFYDQRFYAGWNHMIETQDVGIAGKFTIELPTTDASRTAGKIVAFKFEFNFEIKTPLRNWSFTADTLLKNTFYNDPVAGGAGKTDFLAAIYPYITVDLWSNTQLLFEGSFDANHNYTAAFYDYKPGDPDFIDVGPLFTINSHFNTNIALRFFTDEISFKAAALYANFSAAL